MDSFRLKRDGVRVFSYQIHHFVSLAILLGITFGLSNWANRESGQLFSVSSTVWFGIAIATAIMHQGYVWLAWRGELYHQWLTKRLGSRGFGYFAAIFAVLLISRLVSITLLSISSQDSLIIGRPLYYYIAILFCGVLSLITLYSIITCFGFKRAFGIDHFDPNYRHKPLVRGGIFRYLPNAMYTTGLLVLWLPGIVFLSRAALLVAAFHHIYIWVHYFTVEKPDMRRIYSDPESGDRALAYK